MPFNTLLLTCLRSGTSFGEEGAHVRITPKKDETTLFFSIDSSSNPNSAFREDFDLEGPLCDLIVFYKGANNECAFCFIELKGSDIKHAVKQIINTYEAVKSKIDQDPKIKNKFKRINWKAYVFMTGSAHRDIKGCQRDLIAKFSKSCARISKRGDLDEFIRSN